jgi:hypothetical protein
MSEKFGPKSDKYFFIGLFTPERLKEENSREKSKSTLRTNVKS